MHPTLSKISSATSGNLGSLLVYSAMIGLMLTDAVPNPGDAFASMKEKSLRQKMEDGQITDSKYRKGTIDAASLYAPLWWAGSLLAVFAYKGDAIAKGKLAGLLVFGGILTAIALDGTFRPKPVQVTSFVNATGNDKNVKNVQKRPLRAVMQGNTLKFVK